MPLRYVKECRLNCDSCGTESRHSPDFSASHLRKVALDAGWIVVATDWFCPTCARDRGLDISEATA